MAIKSPKGKGSGGEYEIIKLLTEWGEDVGYSLQLERNLEQVRKGGADVDGVPGLEIEVKRVEANGINSWWAQVCKAAKATGGRPMLCHRKNRQPWRFRVGVYVWEKNDLEGGVMVPVCADLELADAKRWFQGYIQTVEFPYDTEVQVTTLLPPPPPQ